jgi:hypothetical protein
MPLSSEEQAYLRQGFRHFCAGEYFATHEAWEEVWQGLRGRQRLFWQAMIQLAVGAYHLQSGNRKGCQSQWQKALEKCYTLQQTSAAAIPAPLQQLTELLHTCLESVQQGQEPWPHLAAFGPAVVLETWLAFA